LKERVEVLQNGCQDEILPERWSEQVEEFMPSGISHLFLFDGEKIETLADPKNASDLLSTAIHGLLGLDLVDQLRTDLRVLERRKHAEVKTSVASTRIEELSDKLDELDRQREELTSRRAALQSDYDLKDKELRRIETRFRSEGGELYEKRSELEQEREEAKRIIKGLEAQLRDLAASTTPLLLMKDHLQVMHKTAQTESRARTIQGVDTFLVNRDDKLIAFLRKARITAEKIKATELFLKKDRKQRNGLAQTKAYLNLGENSLAQLQNLTSHELDTLSEKASALLAEVRENQEVFVNMERQIAAIPHQDAIALVAKERTVIHHALASLRGEIQGLDEAIRVVVNTRETIEKELVQLLEKAAESQGDTEDRQRIIKHARKVQHSISDFRKRVVGHHVERIQGLVLESFQQLLRKQALISDVRIDPQDYSVRLTRPDGETLPPDRLSAGERQLFAVSMLWGLGRASGRPLPAVVDTPLGRLDTSHRTHLIKRYFPFASHQVLLLSTDEEIDEQYYPMIKPAVGRSYELVFHDKDQYTEVRKGYLF